ncbi:hypothetical protein [Anaeromyxobacter sp. PSR-1]|uniref:hypothetical protein n=1 Tax=Anaeromyxobacter sp. PSR-1 TaxID=1300915 RepID=UPI0005E54268|nr:hypothetical protein [Anaeromyxobacter sp. PSR-1]GAO01928.1 hypothetical protein PSR1_00791 [Anaeromyxobacter sp. PSR-1]
MADELRLENANRLAVKYSTRIPDEIRLSVRNALRKDMRDAKARMMANVSGAVLHRKTGGLASTIKATVRARKWEVFAKAGSRYFIGRFWNYGFNRKGKQIAAKPWATPVVNTLEATVMRNVKQAIDDAIRKGDR